MHPANCSYPKSLLVSPGGKAQIEPGQVILLNNFVMLREVSATPLHPWTFLSQQPRRRWVQKKSRWEAGPQQSFHHRKQQGALLGQTHWGNFSACSWNLGFPAYDGADLLKSSSVKKDQGVLVGDKQTVSQQSVLAVRRDNGIMEDTRKSVASRVIELILPLYLAPVDRKSVV